MFRSATHSGCHGIFQRGRQVSKDDGNFRKFSVSSTASLSPTCSVFDSRNPSISSAGTTSSRGTLHGYNPLSLHPPLAVNKPPKLDDYDEEMLFGDFILEEDEGEDELDNYYSSAKSKQFPKITETPRSPLSSFMPFSPDDYYQFRFNHRVDQPKKPRHPPDAQEELPRPDNDWEAEPALPVEEESWHQTQRNVKRKAMLIRPETFNSTGTYV